MTHARKSRAALLALIVAFAAGCRRPPSVQMELRLAGRQPYPGWPLHEMFSDESASLLVSGPLGTPSWQTLGGAPRVELLDAHGDGESLALDCQPAQDFLRSTEGWRSMRQCTVPAGLSLGVHVIRPLGSDDGRFVLVVRRPPLQGTPRAREYRQAWAENVSREEAYRRAALLRDHVVADPRRHPGELEVALAFMAEAAAGLEQWDRAADLYESASLQATRRVDADALRRRAAECRTRSAAVTKELASAPTAAGTLVKAASETAGESAVEAPSP